MTTSVKQKTSTSIGLTLTQPELHQHTTEDRGLNGVPTGQRTVLLVFPQLDGFISKLEVLIWGSGSLECLFQTLAHDEVHNNGKHVLL